MNASRNTENQRGRAASRFRLAVPGWMLLLLLLAAVTARAAAANDFAARVADRTAVERVYAGHRTGSQKPFEQVLPPAKIEALVRDEAKKEAVLRRVYRVTITPAQVAAEVARINATTRAPETLAEIQRALGDDPARFARSVARPIVVERELRARFDNDDALHAAQRRLAEQARTGALAARKSGIAQEIAALKEVKAGTVNETVSWKLTPRPAADPAAAATAPGLPTTPTSAQVGSRSYSIDATAQIAQTLSPPPRPPGQERERETPYFEDLPAELQQVLGVQLQKAGDVSAVIEMPNAFLVFVAREKTAETLQAASLSLPKKSFSSWLADQPAGE